jgi:hypothetical protein
VPNPFFNERKIGQRPDMPAISLRFVPILRQSDPVGFGGQPTFAEIMTREPMGCGSQCPIANAVSLDADLLSQVQKSTGRE